VRTLYTVAPLFAVAASSILAPAVAHAGPVDDYVTRNGKTVCAALDKAQTGGDIFRLSLTIAHDGGFSLKDAATVIGRAAVNDCPWEESKVSSAGASTTSPAQVPDH
jgi:hypothetical protein